MGRRESLEILPQMVRKLLIQLIYRLELYFETKRQCLATLFIYLLHIYDFDIDGHLLSSILYFHSVLVYPLKNNRYARTTRLNAFSGVKIEQRKEKGDSYDLISLLYIESYYKQITEKEDHRLPMNVSYQGEMSIQKKHKRDAICISCFC